MIDERCSELDDATRGSLEIGILVVSELGLELGRL